MYSDRKCAIVERFNRTLKTRMYRSFTARGTHRWIDILEDLVNGYNNTKHSSIGFKPNAVNKYNENSILLKIDYINSDYPYKKFKNIEHEILNKY